MCHFDGAKIVTAAAGGYLYMVVTEDGAFYWGKKKLDEDYDDDALHESTGLGYVDMQPHPCRFPPLWRMQGARVERCRLIP